MGGQGHVYDQDFLSILEVHQLIEQIVSPFILTVGLFGNWMMIKVMYVKRGPSSFTNYIIAMSISDISLLLVSLFPRWLESFFLSINSMENAFLCQLNTAVFFSIFSMSSWFLVILTMFRAIAVVKPVHFHRLSSPVFLGSVISGVVGLSVTTAVPLVVFTFDFSDCHFGGAIFYPTKDDSILGQVFIWMSFAIIFLIPLLTMLICNCLMIFTFMSLPSSTEKNNELQQQEPGDEPNRKLGCITKMKRRPQLFTVVLISVVFFVSLAPLVVWEILDITGFLITDSEEFLILETLMTQLVYVSAAAKYYLGCVTSTEFRSKLQQTCGKIFCWPKRLFWNKKLRSHSTVIIKWTQVHGVTYSPAISTELNTSRLSDQQDRTTNEANTDADCARKEVGVVLSDPYIEKAPPLAISVDTPAVTGNGLTPATSSSVDMRNVHSDSSVNFLCQSDYVSLIDLTLQRSLHICESFVNPKPYCT